MRIVKKFMLLVFVCNFLNSSVDAAAAPGAPQKDALDIKKIELQINECKKEFLAYIDAPSETLVALLHAKMPLAQWYNVCLQVKNRQLYASIFTDCLRIREVPQEQLIMLYGLKARQLDRQLQVGVHLGMAGGVRVLPSITKVRSIFSKVLAIHNIHPRGVLLKKATDTGTCAAIDYVTLNFSSIYSSYLLRPSYLDGVGLEEILEATLHHEICHIKNADFLLKICLAMYLRDFLHINKLRGVDCSSIINDARNAIAKLATFHEIAADTGALLASPALVNAHHAIFSAVSSLRGDYETSTHPRLSLRQRSLQFIAHSLELEQKLFEKSWPLASKRPGSVLTVTKSRM